ncbi:unnamed protein product [Amoebophrya sp. A25]|nr:unnamed protein product [Amoebophrya sp. A25]|eukprot:GSA25T00017057001.1
MVSPAVSSTRRVHAVDKAALRASMKQSLLKAQKNDGGFGAVPRTELPSVLEVTKTTGGERLSECSEMVTPMETAGRPLIPPTDEDMFFTPAGVEEGWRAEEVVKENEDAEKTPVSSSSTREVSSSSSSRVSRLDDVAATSADDEDVTTLYSSNYWRNSDSNDNEGLGDNKNKDVKKTTATSSSTSALVSREASTKSGSVVATAGESSSKKPDVVISVSQLTLEQIGQHKKHGTVLFKEQKYSQSIDEYSKGVTLCESVVRDHTDKEDQEAKDDSSKTVNLVDIKEKLAAMLGNRALCYLQLEKPKEAFADCEQCLSLFPLTNDCSSSSCKYAYRRSVAGEKMKLDGPEKTDCLTALFHAAERLKVLSMDKEAEAALGLYFRWSRQVSADALVQLARSSGFDVDEESVKRLEGESSSTALAVASGSDNGSGLQGPSAQKGPLHEPIPAESDYFKAGGGEAAERFLDMTAENLRERGIVGPEERDEAELPPHLRSRIDLQAMRERLEKIAAETETAVEKILAENEANTSSTTSSGGAFDPPSRVSTTIDKEMSKPCSTTSVVKTTAASTSVQQTSSSSTSTTRRKIGQFVPVLPVEDSDSDEEEEEDVKEDEGLEKLPEEERKKLEVFQEFMRRKEQRQALMNRWRDHTDYSQGAIESRTEYS